jgi:hypothetical protein
MKWLWVVFFISRVAFGQLWVQQITPGKAFVEHMAIGAKGDCWISGFAVPGTNVPNFGHTNLEQGSFLARYDADGNLTYAEQSEQGTLLASLGDKFIGIRSNEIFQIQKDGTRSHSTTLRSSGDVGDVALVLSSSTDHSFVIAGAFKDSLQIGRQTFRASSTNVWFVARLTVQGRVLWLSEREPSYVADIAGTRNGGARVLGYNFDIQAFDQRGRLIWNAVPPGTFNAQSHSIGTDRSGRSFVTGTMYSGRMESDAYDIVARYGKQAIVCGFTAEGAPLLGWASDRFTESRDLTADQAGNWYVGYFDYRDAFVLKNGDSSTVARIGGPIAYARKLATGRDGSVYITGEGTRVGSLTRTNSGSFLARFKF